MVLIPPCEYTHEQILPSTFKKMGNILTVLKNIKTCLLYLYSSSFTLSLGRFKYYIYVYLHTQT